MLSADAGDGLVLAGNSEDLLRNDVTGTAVDFIIIRSVAATPQLM